MSGQAIETEIKKCSVTSEMKSQFMPVKKKIKTKITRKSSKLKLRL